MAGVLPVAVLFLMLSTGTAQAAGTVGSGTAISCDEAALNTALAGGGPVNFDCGGSPVTITLTTQKVITVNTTVDGGGLVALSGGGLTRTFYVSPIVTLSLANLKIVDGYANDDNGGGVYNAGSLAVSNTTFYNNAANGTNYGGAIYTTGPLTVQASLFLSNSANLRRGDSERTWRTAQRHDPHSQQPVLQQHGGRLLGRRR